MSQSKYKQKIIEKFTRIIESFPEKDFHAKITDFEDEEQTMELIIQWTNPVTKKDHFIIANSNGQLSLDGIRYNEGTLHNFFREIYKL